ncbi:MAG: Gfo/Idh/MocA family oxidoreductase, partial [Gammaproteobacteria bacterium]|nr:Gfo/Idh/MocA family oxidoreductase [Gammaproteobacteria bacterium]
MARKLRVAFIGAGGIAGTHMRYLREMDDVELVAASDVSEVAVKRRSEEFEIPHIYTDYENMLNDVDVDAISVCTPNGFHAPCTLAALEAGNHVLVEKPLAMNSEEGQQMVDKANQQGLKLVIGFQHRYEARTRFVKNAVDEGKLGKILYGRVQALRRRGIPNWGVFGRKELQGGGPLIDIGVHVLEMCHFTMGAPKPVAATGLTHT